MRTSSRPASRREISISSSTRRRSRSTSVDEHLSRPLRLLGHAVEVLAEQRGLARERRQRRAQLVRHVRGEAPFARLRLREGTDLLLERLGHLVERGRPGAELVVGVDRKPGLEEPLREGVGSLARLRDRAENAPGDERAGGRGEHDDEAPPRQEDRSQLREVVVEGLFGEEEVELCQRGWNLPTGDEVRLAGDPDPFVGEVALPHEVLHPGGDLDLQGGEARREGRPFADQCDRLETGTPTVEVHEAGDVLSGGRSTENGSREHEVRARLRERTRDGIVEARLTDDEVRAERERTGRDRDNEGERDREAPSEPARRDDPPHRPRSSRKPTPRTVVISRGRSGSASTFARRRWTAMSTRRESPRYS